VIAQLEPLRRDGLVGNAAQAEVEVTSAPAFEQGLGRAGIRFSYLSEIFGVPSVVRRDPEAATADVPVSVRPAEGVKCPRCWQTRRDAGPDGLCGRCREVVSGGGATA